ncbi:MAG: hypothetical protein KKF62_00320 [Bacteroidetes bacterium]|nr:hypothetical protein [Bacteroidota bacterium]MBU1115634.1 hypothetical protein [Bacteroidota bacterium]MBU1798999.1 hypothetical protein [Bacteroidota bacterium]
MGGKGAILLVLSFSMLFLIFGHRYNWLSSDSIDNYSNYYILTKAHNIAVSAANMAANEVFMDKSWDAGYENVPFDGGSFSVYVSNPTASTVTAAASNSGHGHGAASSKIEICHIPPGNPAARKTLYLPAAAIPAHLAHGDYLGSCDGEAASSDLVTIVAQGTFSDTTVTVYVDLRGSNFAKFGNFYKTVTAYPATGDTFHGPFHVNAKLVTDGKPVFWGKVTAKDGLKKQGSPPKPVFNGGFETGVDIPLEFDTTGMRAAAADNGKVFRDTTFTNKTTNVSLNFLATGQVTYSQQIGSGSWSAPKTVPLATLAPGGVIYVERGNVYVEGIVSGRATIVASKLGSSGFGNIYQTNDLVYNVDPKVNSSSSDMLGLVAEQDIRLQYNTNTRGHDILTMASMFALNGDIGPETALIDYPTLNRWIITGGLIANGIRVTARYSGSNPYKGYKFVHHFDERFLKSVPPYFPHTKNFEVVSWYE